MNTKSSHVPRVNLPQAGFLLVIRLPTFHIRLHQTMLWRPNDLFLPRPKFQKCIFIPRTLKIHTFCAWLSFSMLKISRVSKKGTNHLERVLFMWPALVWERAIMKESKNPTRGGIVSHTRSKKYQNPSLEKSDWSRGEWIWIATPWRNERACLGIWSRYQ